MAKKRAKRQKQQSQSSQSAELHHRVYRVPEWLREAIQETREKRDRTVREFISEAVEHELPDLAQQLLALGIEKPTEVRPARWPLEDHSLRALG